MSPPCLAQRSAPSPQIVWVWLTLLLFLGTAVAETSRTQRSVYASKADVERALQQIRAGAEGRLPTLRGFVNPGQPSLSRYQQARYDYDVQVTTVSLSESLVQVSVEITAWYQDDDPSRSGYQELSSNGRLEEDLFERLGNVLHKDARLQERSNPGPIESDSKVDIVRLPEAKELPDSPSTSKATALLRVPPTASAAPAGEPNAAAQPAADTIESRVRRLEKEEKALKEVLGNQVKPNDLAIVKKSGTRVLSRPADDAPLILVADAEDELQVLERHLDWVRVQLSGPARGWIRTTQLDLSGVSVASVTPKKDLGRSQEQVLQKTREETGTFPGKWERLRGKRVQIIWAQPDEAAKAGSHASLSSLQSLLRQQYLQSADSLSRVDGVVVVLDSSEGGMMATTVSALRRWKQGNLSTDSFWRQCWFDPPSAFSYAR